jgi:N-dimethylarginine dimethylaminohydrolase
VDWSTYTWLKEKGFQFIEIPHDEQKLYNPSNLVMVEPGVVIIGREAKETIKKVRKAGVEVIEVDSDGLLQGGTNGIHCCVGYLYREPGPTIEDPPRRRR